MTITEPMTMATDYVLVVVVLWFAARLGQRERASPSNHNDLYQVIQTVAMWLLYRGGLRVEDRRK